MKSIFSLLILLVFCGSMQAKQDSIGGRSKTALVLFAEGHWASNAVNKYALAGAVFGGDISIPVRSLTALTHWKGGGIAGGVYRSGVRLVLPAVEVFNAPVKGRWKTVVGLEDVTWASATWSPAAATLLFGRHGLGDDGNLGGTAYALRSARLVSIGGMRTERRALQGIPIDMTLEWGVSMGEMDRVLLGGLSRGSAYSWTDEVAQGEIEAMQWRGLSSGVVAGFNFGMTLSEADGGHGRWDRWSVALRNAGRGVNGRAELSRIDTAFTSSGWPLITGEGPDFSGALTRDTLVAGSLQRLPHSLAFRWERDALRTPGVTWSFGAEKVAIAPRWEVALTRRTGRGAVQTEVGLGWGGWGGTYIPLNVTLPSRAVRQGRAGGTLAIRTRWLALAGTGGRMGLGLHWQRAF